MKVNEYFLNSDDRELLLILLNFGVQQYILLAKLLMDFDDVDISFLMDEVEKLFDKFGIRIKFNEED